MKIHSNSFIGRLRFPFRGKDLSAAINPKGQKRKPKVPL